MLAAAVALALGAWGLSETEGGSRLLAARAAFAAPPPQTFFKLFCTAAVTLPHGMRLYRYKDFIEMATASYRIAEKKCVTCRWWGEASRRAGRR